MAGKKLSQMTLATSVGAADGAPILQGGSNLLAPFAVIAAYLEASRGVVNVLSKGGTGLGESDESEAFQDACDDAQSTGGVVYVPPGTWKISSQVIVPEGVELQLAPGAVIIPGADADLFRIKQGAKFSGGKIDLTSLTYTANVFEVAGADRTDGSLLGGMTYIGTEIHGTIEDEGATAFYLHSSGENSHLYRLHVDALVYGLTNGVRMVVAGGEASTGWINGNRFDLRCTYTKTPIKQEIGTGNSHLDGNIFNVEIQSYPPYAAPLIEIEGRYNQVHGNIWDHPSAVAITCASGTLYNNFYVGGVSLTQIDDDGYYNTFFLTTQTQAGVKLDRLYANTDSLLLIDHADTRHAIDAVLSWQRSGGGLAARIFAEGDWFVVKSEQAGVQLQSKTMSIIKTDGSEVARFTSASGDNTALYLWDAANSTLRRVSFGEPDSGGAGYRALRVPNA